ncbi:MAG: JAB domain-containing protein, partial [Verrucomicrobiota bacterium]
LAQESFKDLPVLSPDDVFDLVGSEMQRLTQESVRAILLNHKKRLIHVVEVFLGTGHESFANPPEILRKAIGHAASSLILVHNHPSGDPTPSRADHDVTRRMKSACDAVGLEFTDHIVIGSSLHSNQEPFFSFREAGLL